MQVWLEYHKKKWKMLAQERRDMKNRAKLTANRNSSVNAVGRGNTGKQLAPKTGGNNTIGGFLRRAQHALLTSSWQIIQLAQTSEPGVFKLWALIGSELHQVCFKQLKFAT